MKKKTEILRIFHSAAALISCLFLFTGCTYVNKVKEINEVPPIMEISSDAIHEIDVIELKEAPEDETISVEIQEPEKEKATLSLEECRALTLENNLDLKAELINPTIEKEKIRQEEAKFESTFSGSVSYTKSNAVSASIIQGTQTDSVTTDLGIDMPLRTGGTLSFDLSDTFRKTDSGFYTSPVTYSSGLSASITQPLLKNAGRRASTYSIRLAKYNSSLVDLSTKLNVIRIIADVDKAYWNLYAARRMLEVRNQQYEYAKTTFEETKRFVEVGVKANIEIIRTQKQMADARTLIIKAENDVRQRERALKRMINKKGLGMETKTIIIPSSPPDPVRYVIDRKRMVEQALENRMEMLKLEVQLAMDSMSIDYRRNQILPEFSFTYKYNISGLGTDRGDSYDTLFKGDSNDQTFFLNMNIPLGSKRAKSQLVQSTYDRAKRLLTKENQIAEIKSDVLNQIDNLEASWQSILASRQNTILSDEQYKAEKRQYELGLVNSTDLLKSQTDLADAQRGEIEAIVNYQVALIDLAHATGTLLGAAKVEWAPVVPVNDNMIVKSAE